MKQTPEKKRDHGVIAGIVVNEVFELDGDIL
jgi:hypothetical protein